MPGLKDGKQELSRILGECGVPQSHDCTQTHPPEFLPSLDWWSGSPKPVDLQQGEEWRTVERGRQELIDAKSLDRKGI